MNLTNLFEDDNSRPGSNYAEELAHQIFKVAPDLNATGAADEVLDYAYDLVVNDFGKTKANALFAYDEDFDGDLVSAYADLQRQEVNEGYYDLTQSNVPGMEPIDFSTKPSFKDIIERYTQLVYQGHAGETSPEEDQEYDAIEQYVAKRFGEKGSAHLQKAGEVSYWGRDDKPFGRDSRSSNLGRPNQPSGDFRTTKAGKMHGQDAKMMKAKVADRLGRHPAPNLPESLADEFMAMAKAKGMNPRLRGTPDEERARTDAMLKQRAADRAAQPAPAGPDAEERARLEARLKELEAKFDPNFEYSDDHSFWTAQKSISDQINSIKKRLSQGMTEADAQVNGQDVDVGVVVGKLKKFVANAEQQLQNADYDQQRQYATTVRDRAMKALEMIQQGGNTPDAANAAFKYMQTGAQGVAEADKKKEDDIEPQVKDVALQRAISRAKADFPAAGSGIEALAKDFMRSQDQDSKSFDQLRQAERKQDQMLGQISKIDQEQEQEIQGLENQNSTLASRLQQLQNVNVELEKKLAAMSGRRAEKKSTAADAPVAPAPVSSPTSAAKPAVATKKKTPNAEPTTSKAIGQIAKTLAPTPPSAAIDQMAQQLQPRQKELDFDNNPVTLKPKKFDTSKASDAEYRDLTTRIAKDIISRPDAAQAFNTNAVRSAAGQQEMPLENKDKTAKSDRPEADYGDEYQDMVKRVKHLAGQGPRKTVWDPVKRVYKTVPVNK